MTAVTMKREASEAALKERIIEFVRGASVEITPYNEALLPELPEHFALGTTLYIAHPPRWQLQDVVRIAGKVQRLGFLARPHIIARALDSEPQLRLALTQLHDVGIDQILLVSGDLNSAAGPFSSTLEVLDTEATVNCGITTVAVAGHPEGHHVIGPSLLWDALRAKQAFGQRTGTKVEIVTQFGFNPQAIFDWQRHCRELGIMLPVHVGLAGPASLPRLIHFAMQCGIGNSLHALMKSTSALTHLARVTITPEEMLVGLMRHPAASPSQALVKPHFFCFGGSLETARWLRAVIDGAFALNAEGSRFSVWV